MKNIYQIFKRSKFKFGTIFKTNQKDEGSLAILIDTEYDDDDNLIMLHMIVNDRYKSKIFVSAIDGYAYINGNIDDKTYRSDIRIIDKMK